MHNFGLDFTVSLSIMPTDSLNNDLYLAQICSMASRAWVSVPLNTS